MTCPRCNDTGYVGAEWCDCDARPIDTSAPLVPRELTPAQHEALAKMRAGGRVLGDLSELVRTDEVAS